MDIDFETPISRAGNNSVKWERYSGQDILPMWLADMDLPIARPIQDALIERIHHPVLGYSTAPRDLVEVVCETLARDYGWHIEPEWLVWLPGVLPGLVASCRLTGAIGDDIIIAPPVFSEFFHVVDHAQRRLETVPLKRSNGRWELDIAAIENVITANTCALLLCSPNNPTGTVFTRTELRKLVECCARHNVLVISDEIHCGLIMDLTMQHTPTAVAAAEYADNIITLMSPSKTFNLGGVNCAFAIISNDELRRRFHKSCEGQGIMPMASALGYTAALAAYRDAPLWHQKLLEHLRSNYAYLQQALDIIPGLELTPLEATYLAWIDVSQLNLKDPKAFFEQYGVGLSPGAEFGERDFVRMNFGCARSTLELAVQRIADGVQNLFSENGGASCGG